MSLGQMMTCLDIFRDVGLLDVERMHRHIVVRIRPNTGKVDLTTSKTMQLLLQAKES